MHRFAIISIHVHETKKKNESLFFIPFLSLSEWMDVFLLNEKKKIKIKIHDHNDNDDTGDKKKSLIKFM